MVDEFFHYDEYLEDKKISFERAENYYVFSKANVSAWIQLADTLMKDLMSFDACKKYLGYADGAIVYENVINFLKDKNIAYNIPQENKLDCCFYNHDWWLDIYNSAFALGYGAGSMWLYVKTESDLAGRHKKELERLGFTDNGSKKKSIRRALYGIYF